MDGDCKYKKHISVKIKNIVTLVTVEVEKQKKKHREDVRGKKFSEFHRLV